MTVESFIWDLVKANPERFSIITQGGDEYLSGLIAVIENSKCSLPTAISFIDYVMLTKCKKDPYKVMFAAIDYIEFCLGISAKRESEDIIDADMVYYHTAQIPTPDERVLMTVNCFIEKYGKLPLMVEAGGYFIPTLLSLLKEEAADDISRFLKR